MVPYGMLRPRDVFVAFELLLAPDPQASFGQLERDIGLRASAIHRSVQRLRDAGLVTPKRVIRSADLFDFLVFGVRYAFYVLPGPPTRGMPTAHAAPPLVRHFTDTGDVPVWPDPDGTTRGFAVDPLDPLVPRAARRNAKIYELLALVDAIRLGRPRERNLAVEELRTRMRHVSPERAA
jgi:DNA-binding transcriptional ArsR family regulator